MVENIKLRDLTNGSVLELSQENTPYYILKEADWGTIQATHNQTRYVKQIGTTLVSTVLGIRDIEISGWVIARNTNQMITRKTNLNNFFNPLHDYQIEYLGYKLGVIFNQSIRYAREIKGNNEVICEWKIEGISTDPLFYEIGSNATESTDSDAKFMFPCSFNSNTKEVVFGEVKLNSIIAIMNTGQVDVGLQIYIKCFGPVTNPIITNVQTGEFIKINKVLSEGEEIFINTSIGNKSIKGRTNPNSDYTNYYNYRDFESSWLQLIAGISYFVVTAEGNYENLKVVFNFNRAYMEVQKCE